MISKRNRKRIYALLSVIVIAAMLCTTGVTSFADSNEPPAAGGSVAGETGGGQQDDPSGSEGVDPADPTDPTDPSQGDPDAGQFDPATGGGENQGSSDGSQVQPGSGENKDESGDKKDDSKKDDGKTNATRDGSKNGDSLIEDEDDDDTPAAHRDTIETDSGCILTVSCEKSAGIPDSYKPVVVDENNSLLSDEQALAISGVSGDVLPYKNFIQIAYKKGDNTIVPKDSVSIEVSLSMPADLAADDRGVLYLASCGDASSLLSSSKGNTISFTTKDLSVYYGFLYAVTYKHQSFDAFMNINKGVNELEVKGQLKDRCSYTDADLQGLMTFTDGGAGIEGKLTADTTAWKLTRTAPNNPFTDATLKIRLANGYDENGMGDYVTINLYDNPILYDKDANYSGKVKWSLYNVKAEDGTLTKKKLVFNLDDPDNPDLTPEDKAIARPLRRITSYDPETGKYSGGGRNTEIDYENIEEVEIGKGITGIGWYYVGISGNKWDNNFAPILAGTEIPGIEGSTFGEYKDPGTKTGSWDGKEWFPHCDVFADFAKLTTVTFAEPSSIEVIGWSAFRRCKNLKEFNFAQLTGLKVIMNQAFNPTSLETVDLSHSDGLKIIGYSAFNANEGSNQTMKYVYFPDKGQVEVSKNAFANNANIQAIGLGNGTHFYDPETNLANNLRKAKTVYVNGESWPTDGNGKLIDFIDKSVQELHITADNPDIPKDIFKNTPLKRLYIEGDYITLDPETFTKTSVKEVYITGNNVTIPPEISSVFDDVDTLVLAGDDTTIGSSAFAGAPLKNIIVQGDGINIGTYAFSNCSDLELVSIGGKDAQIGANAFDGCSDIKRLVIPGNDVVLGNNAFNDCTGLASVFITGSIASGGMGTGVFDGCSELQIVSIAYPGVLEDIPDETFKDCKNLRTLTMTGTIYTIGTEAFSGCTSLEKVTLPTHLTSLGDSAFEGCTSLAKLTINGDLKKTGNVNAFGAKAFAGCTSLEKVTINGHIDEIPTNAFDGCRNLATLTVSDDASVGTIAANAFKGFSHLEHLNLNGTIDNIGNSAFQDCRALETLTLPEGLKTLGNSAFEGCRGLSALTIQGDLKKEGTVNAFGSKAFKDCTDLETVTISGHIDEIPSDAFDGCRNLTTLTVSGATETKPAGSVGKIGDNAFAGLTHLESLNFSGTVQEIGTKAFEGCRALQSVTLPTGLTKLGASAFEGCTGLTSLTIDSDLSAADAFGNSAFKDCTRLATVTVNGKVDTISTNTFEGCRSLTTLTVATNGSIKRIDNRAFAGATHLTTLQLNGTVEEIGTSAFEGCRGLQTVTLPEGLKKLEPSAFKDCTNLTTLDINSQFAPVEGVVELPASAFAGCKSLTTVDLSDSNITTIGQGTFKDCRALTDLDLPANLKAIGDNAFESCANLANVDWPTSLTEIGEKAFLDCKSLTSGTFPEGLTKIDDNAFQNCRGLQSVTLPRTLKDLGDNAFKDCTKLTTLTVKSQLNPVEAGSSEVAFPASAIAGCSSLTSVNLDESNITKITAGTFNGYSKLAVVDLPVTMTSIEENAFKNCSNLRDIDLPDNLATIGSSAFEGCSKLTEADLPENLTSLGTNAFKDCTKLTTVSVADKLESIQTGAFEGCSKLAILTLEDASKLQNIADTAFDNTGLRRIYDETGKKKVFSQKGAKALFGDKITDDTFAKTNILAESPSVVVKVNDVSVPYDSYEHEGSDKINMSGLQSDDTATLPAYTKAKGTELGTYSGSFAGTNVLIKDKQNPSYDSYDNYESVTLTAGTLTIAKNPREIMVYVTGNKDTATYNGKSHSVSGYTMDTGAVRFERDDYIFTGSDRAKRTDAGTTGMGLEGKFKANPSGHYPNAKFYVVDGSVTIDPADVHVSIVGHAGRDIYDHNDHTTEGFEFTASHPLYKRSDFTYSGSVSATRRDVGTTYMNLSPSQFRNTNKNFNATFSVSDGNQSIDKNTVHVTITGHTATDDYDGETHTVEGFEYTSDNPAYQRSDFEFSGSATASREDVGTSYMGLSLGQFRNLNDNFNVSFTIVDGYQSIELTAGRSASMFSANLANRVFPGGGLYLTSNDHWGLLNLVFMVITILIALWSVLWRNFRDSDTPLKFSLLNEILSAVPPILSVALFFVTENLSLPMKIFDQWSFVMALFVLVEWTIVYMMKLKEDEKRYGRNTMRV